MAWLLLWLFSSIHFCSFIMRRNRKENEWWSYENIFVKIGFIFIASLLANTFGSKVDYWISYFSDCLDRSWVRVFNCFSFNEVTVCFFKLEYSFLSWQHYPLIILPVNGNVSNISSIISIVHVRSPFPLSLQSIPLYRCGRFNLLRNFYAKHYRILSLDNLHSKSSSSIQWDLYLLVSY